MQKVIVIFALITIQFQITFCQEEKLNIAVLELEGNNVSQGDLGGLSNRLRTELFKTGKFNVIERSRMNEILKEQGFQQTGCTNAECAIEAGQLIGVSKIVIGSVDKVGTIYTVDIRMVDVATGKIEKTATEDCEDCTINKVLKVSIRKVAYNLYSLKNINELKNTKNSNYSPKKTIAQKGPTVSDIDGNVYNTVKIGNQVWTMENLRTTKYKDGTPIPKVTDESEWSNLKKGAYCYYNNYSGNKEKYGALYNWYAVNTGKLAPDGWHVPTDADWQKLEDYIIANGYNWGGSTTGYKTAKSLASKTGGKSLFYKGDLGNNMSSHSSSGFSALPGGQRVSLGVFNTIGTKGNWWSATQSEADTSIAYSCYLNTYSGNLGWSDDDDKVYGFSVRLVRD